MSKYIKIEIINTGGEFTYGFITNKNEIELMKNKINLKEDIYPSNDFNNKSINYFEYTQLISSFGPALDNAKLNIIVYKDENCNNIVEELIDLKNIDDYNINFFMEKNPFVSKKTLKEYNKETLQFGSYIIEKNIYFPMVIKLDDDEQLDLSNLFVGYIDMDEILSDDQIISSGYYIRKKEQKKIIKLFLKECNKKNKEFYKNCEFEFNDYLNEIFSNKISDNMKNFLNNFELDTLDIEGAGLSKSQYVIIKDMNIDDENFSGSTLFEKTY